MTTLNSSLNLKHLKETNHRSSIVRFLAIFNAVKTVGMSVLHYLVSGNDMHISHHRDRNGTEYWHIYDPINRIATRLNSEAEVRTWIEQRYYRTTDWR